MKENIFLKCGKIFLSSLLISTYSFCGFTSSYERDLQQNNSKSTSITTSVISDNNKIKDTIESIKNKKNNIKNNSKMISNITIKTMNSDNIKKVEKKKQSLSRRIFSKLKNFISAGLAGVEYILKYSFVQQGLLKILDEKIKRRIL